jgi:hypothetical protein
MEFTAKNVDFGDKSLVYVRKIATIGLSEELQEEIGPLDCVYSVHRPDGEQIALVADRKMAFALALQHDLAPVSVH